MAASRLVISSSSSSSAAVDLDNDPREQQQGQQQQPQQQQQLQHQHQHQQQATVMHLKFPILAYEGHQYRDRRWVVRSGSVTESRRVSDDQMLVYVPPHPLIKHWISVLRNELSPPPIFKSALAELGRFLIYEASRDWLTTVKGEVQTPCGVANVEFIDPRDPVRVRVSESPM